MDNKTLRLPPQMLLLLMDANSTSVNGKGTGKTLEGRQQLVGWPKPQRSQLSQPTALLPAGTAALLLSASAQPPTPLQKML